jgi:hypothetical protein
MGSHVKKFGAIGFVIDTQVGDAVSRFPPVLSAVGVHRASIEAYKTVATVRARTMLVPKVVKDGTVV